MSAETLARWQFGITTVYHFFFVPITIALSILVAVLQTLWTRSGDEKFLRLTKFYGKIFLINFAMGVVTGIVQEFQFGMNWSEYSRFVGDIFGAPLALEALLAFFLESTFLGIWIFGWDRLSKKVHLAMIWLGSIGTVISSIFILLANSWMQNPVGATYNPELRRAAMGSLLDVILNPVGLVTIGHTWAASAMTAGGLILGVAGWHIAKVSRGGSKSDTTDVPTFRWAAKFGATIMLVACVGVIITGDLGGKVMATLQPGKIAASENLQKTQACAGFQIIPGVEIPCVVSFLAFNDFNATVIGIDDANKIDQQILAGQTPTAPAGGVIAPQNALQKGAAADIATMYAKASASGETLMIMPTFWSFRMMMGLGGLGLIISIIALLKLKGKDKPLPKFGSGWTAMMVAAPLLPLFASSFGWMMTEFGRQPWIVNGVVPTSAAWSPGVTAPELAITMVLYTAIYGALAVVEVGLLLNAIKKGLPAVKEPEVLTDADAPLTFAY